MNMVNVNSPPITLVQIEFFAHHSSFASIDLMWCRESHFFVCSFVRSFLHSFISFVRFVHFSSSLFFFSLLFRATDNIPFCNLSNVKDSINILHCELIVSFLVNLYLFFCSCIHFAICCHHHHRNKHTHKYLLDSTRTIFFEVRSQFCLHLKSDILFKYFSNCFYRQPSRLSDTCSIQSHKAVGILFPFFWLNRQ